MLRTLIASLISSCIPLAAQTQVTLGAIKDNTLYFDAAGGLSNGAGSRMFAGRTNTLTNGVVRRALVAFDIAAIPRRSTIRSVTVSLYLAQTLVPSQQVDLHRVSADWGEGASIAGSGQGGGGMSATGDATWIHRRFPSENWASAGGDFVAAPSASTTVNNLPAVYTWSSTAQLVADVQAWVDNPGQNFGWMVRADETQLATAIAFETKESTIAANRPSVTITYDPPPAIVTPTGTGCTGGGSLPLALAASGLPIVPNPSFALLLSGGPVGPSVLLMTVTLFPVPIPIAPGCFVYVDPFTLIVTLPAGPMVPLPVPAIPELVGTDLSLQGAAVNGGTLALATSNALTLGFGL